MDVRGKTVVVTGGCGGFGRLVSERLADKGASVCIIDINTESMSDVSSYSDKISVFRCDITSAADVESCINEIAVKFGTIDVLINNAGILHNEPLIKFGPGGVVRHSAESWKKVMSVNLDAVFYVTSAVVEKMLMKRTRGVIVNISSIAAQGNMGQTAYSASKAAVEAMTKTWAMELGMLGIRSVCVAPGYSDTASTHAVMKEGNLEQIVSEIPLKRLGKPMEIVDGILFSIENDFFNGKVLSIDGGLIF